MPKANALTDTDRARIRELHGQGVSCNAIARQVDRSPSTVSRAAKAMGLSWDTAQTAVATEVKQASNRERRAELVGRLYDRADKIMDRLDADKFKMVGFSKAGYAKVTPIDQDAIPGAEERALFGMVINALNGAARLEAVDAGHTSGNEAKGILGNLADALQGAYGQLSHAGGTATAKLVERDLDDSTDTDSQP